MWPDVLKIKYDYHQVDQPWQKILLEPVTQFIQNLTRQVERYEEDLLSNHSAIHITGTEEQASSDLWHNMSITLLKVFKTRLQLMFLKFKEFESRMFVSSAPLPKPLPLAFKNRFLKSYPYTYTFHKLTHTKSI